MDKTHFQPAIFLDRDGVINNIVKRSPTWIGSPRTPDEWQLMAGIQEAVQLLHDAGYLIIVITNQPEIARNQTTRAQLDALHALMCQQIPQIDEVFFCPHDNEANCDCRKPKPGLILKAMREWGIDLKNSWMVGDRDKDIVAGQAAGCKTCLIQNEYHYPCEPDLICKSVLEFAQQLIRTKQSK